MNKIVSACLLEYSQSEFLLFLQLHFTYFFTCFIKGKLTEKEMS